MADQARHNKRTAGAGPALAPLLAGTRPLTGDRFADLEAVFAAKGCSFARSCWCMDYRIRGKLPVREGQSAKETKRAMMRALADTDPPPGLVGYDADDTPIGWVTVGPRAEFLRLAGSQVMKPVDDVAVWSVVCFVVPSPLRGRGIADGLLAAAVTFARGQGAPAVEGYPVDRPQRSQPQFLWHGAISMFDRAGFREIARRKPERPVMRLDLGSEAAG